jgi:hypothetical protein
MLIVSFGLHIIKLDDPKAFFKGELLYPIYARCPPGVDHLAKYAPYGNTTRWRIAGAIYGLIANQASLKYFEKSSEALRGIGYIQCPSDKALFFKWFTKTLASACHPLAACRRPPGWIQRAQRLEGGGTFTWGAARIWRKKVPTPSPGTTTNTTARLEG